MTSCIVPTLPSRACTVIPATHDPLSRGAETSVILSILCSSASRCTWFPPNWLSPAGAPAAFSGSYLQLGQRARHPRADRGRTESEPRRSMHTMRFGVPMNGRAAQALPAGTCSILDLVLGPLHLDLLGLVVDLNRVHLSITGDPAGGILERLLCGVANTTPPAVSGSPGVAAVSACNRPLRTGAPLAATLQWGCRRRIASGGRSAAISSVGSGSASCSSSRCRITRRFDASARASWSLPIPWR